MMQKRELQTNIQSSNVNNESVGVPKPASPKIISIDEAMSDGVAKNKCLFNKINNKKIWVVSLIFVLVILVIGGLFAWKYYDNQQKKATEQKKQIQAETSQIIKDNNNVDETAADQFIKDVTKSDAYQKGADINLDNVKSFDTAYALALSLVKKGDYNNALVSYGLAESKLDTNDKVGAYNFYKDYGLAEGYAKQYKLALEKFNKAKEAVLASDIANHDPLYKQKTIATLDEIIDHLKGME